MRRIGNILRQMSCTVLSPAEKDMVQYLCDLPEHIPFETNYPVGPYFIDIAMPEHKVGLEIDGWKYHTSEKQLAHDAIRDKYLTVTEGWTVARLPAWFIHRHPDLSLFQMLRYIPDMQDTSLYKRLYGRLIQYNIREEWNKAFSYSKVMD